MWKEWFSLILNETKSDLGLKLLNVNWSYLDWNKKYVKQKDVILIVNSKKYYYQIVKRFKTGDFKLVFLICPPKTFVFLSWSMIYLYIKTKKNSRCSYIYIFVSNFFQFKQALRELLENYQFYSSNVPCTKKSLTDSLGDVFLF